MGASPDLLDCFIQYCFILNSSDPEGMVTPTVVEAFLHQLTTTTDLHRHNEPT